MRDINTFQALLCCHVEQLQVVRSLDLDLMGRTKVQIDCDTTEQLKGPLEEYVNKRYPGLVKIVRNQKREGLIRARIEGWKVASAEATGFFDAHVEFTPSW